MIKSRRDFIKTALATSALAPLSGCSSLDQIFSGESLDEGDRILILGAGLAGLSAAYYLKKNQVPFRLFEASSRMGGRVLTIRDIGVSSRHGELGGERIEPDHSAIQNLAAELKIPLNEVSPKESLAWFEKGHILTAKEWHKDLAELTKLFRQIQLETYGPTPQILNYQNRDQFPKAQILDRLSAAELMDRLQMQLKPSMRTFLEQVIRSEWGVEPFQISSLHLVHWMRDSFRLTGMKYLKISGGSSVLTQALLDRIGGVVPERFVRFQHQLLEVRKNETGWTLVFRTPSGKAEIKGRRIICTLPATMLRHVIGWELIPMSPEKKKLLSALQLGTHGKILMGFQERFWGDTSVIGMGGTLYSDLPTPSFSEAGDPITSGLNTSHGVLQSQLGGLLGEQAGPHSVQQALKDLGKIDPRSASYEGINYVQNWKNFPWTRGSRCYLKPGQFQIYDAAVDSNDSWLLAGEAHNLASLGTMNAAVQSAFEAAARFLKTSG